MYWQKKIKKDGSSWYQFIYYDQKEKKNKKVPKSESFFVKTDEEADQYCRNKEAEFNSSALRIKLKLEWMDKHHNFKNYLELFEEEHKVNAPNTYKNAIYYLKYYVFPFFLKIKQNNNILTWYYLYDDFKKYLLNVKTDKNPHPLAYHTRNHCIISLNQFVKFMFKKEKFKEQLFKCDLFPDHLTAKRTIDDIYLDHEVELIKNHLKDSSNSINNKYYEFFTLLIDTGMRINEARGLSIEDILKGMPPDDNIQRAYKTFNINCFAYIHLRTQPLVHRKAQIRNKDGVIERKDLKAKAKVREEDKSRTIPIQSTELFNILSKRRLEQIKLKKAKKHGENSSDYLLFEDVIISSFENALKKACSSLQLRYREPHCCRHTFATKMAGKTLGNHLIVGGILGHTKTETTANYLHINGLLNKNIEVQKSIKSDDDWGVL